MIVDCDETIKLEDIKEEINEEESVEDPLSIHQEEMNEEESVEVPLSIHEETEKCYI